MKQSETQHLSEANYKFLSIIILLLLSSQGCSPSDLQVSSNTTIPPSPSSSPSPKATITRIPSKTPTVTPTAVPVGIFTLKFYPPLVMTYDPLLWEDRSEYTNPDWMINYLQSRTLPTCKIGVQGPTDFNGQMVFVDVQLGKLKFSVTFSENTESAEISGMYIEQQSIPNYDYSPGLPIPAIIAGRNEWKDCKKIAEEVLATLQVP